MAKRVRNTFGNLNRALQSMGFEAIRRDDHVVFTHGSGRPMILLPAYKSGQAVKPIHLMMVRKQLTDVGMIKPGALAFKIPSKSPAPSKP